MDEPMARIQVLMDLDDQESRQIRNGIQEVTERTDQSEEDLGNAVQAFAQVGYGVDEIVGWLLPATAIYSDRWGEHPEELAHQVATVMKVYSVPPRKAERFLKYINRFLISRGVIHADALNLLERMAPILLSGDHDE